MMGFLKRLFRRGRVAHKTETRAVPNSVEVAGVSAEVVGVQVTRDADSFPIDLPEIYTLSTLMLNGCGLQVVSADAEAADSQVTISFGAEPMGTEYGDGHNHYASARVHGRILIRLGSSCRSLLFAGTCKPMRSIYQRHYTKEREAPFREALWASDFIESFSKLASAVLRTDQARSLAALIRHGAWHRACELLAELGGPAVGPLIGNLADHDFRIRQAVANALTSIGRPAVGPLTKLSGEADWLLAQTAENILGRIEDRT